MALDTNDKTPKEFRIINESFIEKFKKILRRYLYPIYLSTMKGFINKKFGHLKKIGVGEIFLGYRGTDYEALRKRVNRIKTIKHSTILIIGVGTGRDLESWLQYEPKKIIAVDYFNYTRAWKLRKEYFNKKYKTEIIFLQADITDLKKIENKSIDIVGSDAVFEHVKRFDEAIEELTRVLKKNGILYANFGPLWHSWGGDHISGTDNFINAYNHLRLNKKNYSDYLETFGEYSFHEQDGRTWIKNDMFSYLKPKEYLDIIEKNGLIRKYTSCVIDKRTLKYQNLHPNTYNELVSKFGENNLLITGMTIIYANQ
ncbi:MAG: hypothetical protein CBC19_01275 [Oceanospirillales bacterium TMED59]|nr:MAG: hypothetical protein CBC19_01275 [Oceanospirillales bacterium TMED59]|tara:strand:- start:883 stop:1821 length:939 start_codon:yes stop_codon:yes gene_type:complete